MFRLALKAGPTDADNLGNYANFLCDERRDLSTAETMYKRALDAAPKDADILGNYATFLCDERRDVDAAEAMYKRALDAAPKHADILGNYATFLWDERRDQDAAEAMYKQALDVDRKHANNLGNYAHFLLDERKDRDAAEAMYKRALKADPKHANNLGNYGRICLETGRMVEGMELVDRAVALLPAGKPRDIDAECWMYVCCCGAPERRLAALTRLRQLVEVHAIKTGTWDFSGVIRQAQRMEHPEAAWLPVLAEVLAGRQPSTALEAWEAWSTAD
jgi:Tfp pilus assembly protein PilF